MSLPPVPLASLADVRAGGGAPQDSAAFSESGYPFVRAGSLSKLLDGAEEAELEKIEPQIAADHGLKLFPSGTVLFAKSGMSATKGYVYRLKEPAYIVNHLAALVPHDPADSSFLMRALQKFSPTSLIKDPAYPSIRLGDIEEMTVLAPRTVYARQRIGEILDQADGLRQERRKTFKRLDDLRRAIFREMFGDPVKNERGWPRVPLGKLIPEIDSGWSPTCLDRRAADDEWGVLKLSAVTSCRYDDTAQKALPEGVKARESIEVRTGDVLFTRKNTHDLVAACALVRKTRPRLMLSDLIFRLCIQDKSVLGPDYLQGLLSYPTKRKEIQKLAGGAAGSMPNISKGRLKGIEIELPPSAEQLEFVRRTAAIEELREQHGVSLRALNALFGSLQHRAFRGEL